MRLTSTFRSLRRNFAALVLAAGSATTAFAADPEVVATGLQFPEATIFVDDVLYFTDYSTSDVLRMVDGKVQPVWHQDGCGANGLAAVDGELLVACYESGTVVRITTAGAIMETIRRDEDGGVFTKPNDLAADALGGVYFTASGSEKIPGKIYYLAASGEVNAVADHISNANGIAVSNDGKLLYVGESGKRRLLSFEIGVGGKLSHQSELVVLSNILGGGPNTVFSPDGVRLDRHGRLFVALYDGGGFAVLGGDGKLIAMVRLRAAHHTNLAISPDGKSVFVTAIDDAPDNAYRGEVFKVANPVAE
jgi:gluconolactonase